MKTKNLLFALTFSVIMLATTQGSFAQSDSVRNDNNVVMNTLTYTPVPYERGATSAGLRIFPNPASTKAIVYTNSIKERDNGEMLVYSESGALVMRNTIQPGNNEVAVANLARGMYIVRVVTKDKAVYTIRLMVSR